MSKCVCVLSHVRLFVTPWTIVCQGPLSMEFSRQEYWSGLPFPTPMIFPTLVSNSRLLHLLQDRQILYHWAIWEAHHVRRCLPKSQKLGFFNNTSFMEHLTHINSFALEASLMRWEILALLIELGNWGSEKLRVFPNAAQQNQAELISNCRSFPLNWTYTVFL